MTRARRRRLLALVYAVLAALSLAAIAARASERPHPRTIPTVTSLPYVTPWQADFERYSTLPVTPRIISSNSQLQIIVPAGQYWRLIAMNGRALTDATVGNRLFDVQLQDAQGNVLFKEGLPGVAVASGAAIVAFGPEGTSFVNAVTPTTPQMFLQIPDLLIGPGSSWLLTLSQIGAGDVWQNGNAAALVEVYTPLKDIPPSLLPMPAIP